MVTFLGSLFLVSGLLIVVTTPVFVLAWRRKRMLLARKFLIAVGAIGLFSAIGSVSSERLVDNCRDAGNYYCLDAGFTGFLFLIGLIYLIAVGTATYMLTR